MGKLKWLEARCPICGRRYRYLPNYKPSTCSNYDCVHKWIHRKEVMFSGQRTRETTAGQGSASTPHGI